MQSPQICKSSLIFHGGLMLCSFLYSTSNHSPQGKGGRDNAANRPCGHNHLWVDGLLPPLWKYARYSTLCSGQVACKLITSISWISVRMFVPHQLSTLYGPSYNQAVSCYCLLGYKFMWLCIEEVPFSHWLLWKWNWSYIVWQVPGGVVLPDKTSLYLTAIEDAEYKQEKISCECLCHGVSKSLSWCRYCVRM